MARRLRTLRPRVMEAGTSVSLGTTYGWQPDSVRGSRQQRGYGRAWEKKRKRILERDSHLCQPGLKLGRVEVATQVDHITQKADGGSDDDDNLQSICDECHRTKTSRESRGGV